ncbi:hypothetical protein HK096_010900 [Nowakowskiella sp. JEL0078]|nr:hypothetical protein HK096_010900 [Nowakowskiella sp. JEL0078]
MKGAGKERLVSEEEEQQIHSGKALVLRKYFLQVCTVERRRDRGDMDGGLWRVVHGRAVLNRAKQAARRPEGCAVNGRGVQWRLLQGEANGNGSAECGRR